MKIRPYLVLVFLLLNSGSYGFLQTNINTNTKPTRVTTSTTARKTVQINNYKKKEQQLQQQQQNTTTTVESTTSPEENEANELLKACLAGPGVIGFARTFYQFYLDNPERSIDANFARNICRQTGGFLAKLDDEETRNAFSRLVFEHLLQDELRGSVEVKILKHPLRPRYKFRPVGLPIEDPHDFPNWTSPSEKGEISSFRLFPHEVKDERRFNKEVHFCWERRADSIREQCLSSDHENFRLFAANPLDFAAYEGASFIPLLNFVNPLRHAGYVTLKLSSNLRPTLIESSLPVIYLPDAGVLTGARSDKGEETWIFGDGSVAIDQSYPPSDPSYCQQLSWQFSYNNSINFYPKRCLDKSSKFLCEYSVQYYLEPVACKGKKLNLSWNAGIIKSLDDSFQLHTTVSSTRDCFLQSISEEVIARTSYGRPLMPKGARLLKADEHHTEFCILQWTHDYFQNFETLYYRVSLRNNFEIQFHYDYDIPQNPSREDLRLNIIQYNVTIPDHMKGSRITFDIQGFSCEGGGEIATVPQRCNVLTPTRVIPRLGNFAIIGLFSTIGGIFVLIFTAVNLRSMLTKIQQQGKAKQRLKNLRRKKEIEQKNLLYPATNSSTTNPSYLEADYYYAAENIPLDGTTISKQDIAGNSHQETHI